MDVQKSQEEKLREAACVGDFDRVQQLLTQGVDPNSQNVMNGWTALHWSAKRGHRNIAQVLLDCGADINIVNSKGETAANLATDASLVKLLGGVTAETTVNKTEDGLVSFTPHYLAHPPLNPRAEKALNPNLPIEQPLTSTSMNKPAKCANCCALSQDGPPRDMVLKVRVANSPDPDFIEVELGETSFAGLLRVCCEELGVAAQRVTRVRKLPNTVVRKDSDVHRLQYLQEIELVVEGTSGGGPYGVNGELPVTKSNSYQSISQYKNQTILY